MKRIFSVIALYPVLFPNAMDLKQDRDCVKTILPNIFHNYIVFQL